MGQNLDLKIGETLYVVVVQPRAPDGRLPGQVHFENLCMKAVNQSIGMMLFYLITYFLSYCSVVIL